MRFGLLGKLPRYFLSTPFRLVRFKRCCIYTVVAIFVLELVLLNLIFLYIFATARKIISVFQSDSPESGGVIDKLQAAGVLQKDVMQTAKYGGISKVLEMTVDRLYIARVPSDNDYSGNPVRSGDVKHSDLFVFGVDVSDSGEALYVYKQILKRKKFPFSKLVVDIGANDGLLSSNSFNFIQWGWNAILVEPLQTELDLAKENTKRYRDLSGRKRQNVTFVRAVIGVKNGLERLVLSSDPVHMENHIPYEEDQIQEETIIQVPSLTVKRFASLYNVPKYFGVLSLDAEGIGDMILHHWIDLKYRPAYIIYEKLHNEEPLPITAEYLANAGYKYLIKLGWNYIFEFQGMN